MRVTFRPLTAASARIELDTAWVPLVELVSDLVMADARWAGAGAILHYVADAQEITVSGIADMRLLADVLREGCAEATVGYSEARSPARRLAFFQVA